MAATAPAASEIHGASAGLVNGGGLSAASREPTATIVPVTIATVRVTRGRRPNTSQRTSPVTATQAVSIDHRTSNAHAPANPEPVLNLVHGNSVASTATASDAPTMRSTGERDRRQGRGTGAAGMSSPRTSDRHSGPNTRPRTGTAHSTQSGRPHTSHVPTVSRDGCVAHRSVPFVVRSSVGIVEAYAPVLGTRTAW